MSLEGKKRNNPPPSFVLKSGKKPGHVTMFEKDEDGSLGISNEGMEFKEGDLHEDPIDLLTHELSERELKRTLEKNKVNPFKPISRFTSEGAQYDMIVPHIMVSHHTKSGLLDGEKEIKLTSDEFKVFLSESKGLSDLYPQQHSIMLKWNALMDRTAQIKTKEEYVNILNEAKKIKRESESEITPKLLKMFEEIIFMAEKKL